MDDIDRPPGLTIGRPAIAAGMTPKALRHHDRIGLLLADLATIPSPSDGELPSVLPV